MDPCSVITDAVNVCDAGCPKKIVALGRWHLDEVLVSINGKRMYLWRAVDSEGEVLDIPAFFISAHHEGSLPPAA